MGTPAGGSLSRPMVSRYAPWQRTRGGQPLPQEEAAALRVVSVNFSVSPWNDWQCVVTAILKGAESAGASTESYFFSTGAAAGQPPQAGPGDPAEPDVSFLVSRLRAADCAMLGIAGAVDLNGSLFGRFVGACLAVDAAAGGSRAGAQPIRRHGGRVSVRRAPSPRNSSAAYGDLRPRRPVEQQAVSGSWRTLPARWPLRLRGVILSTGFFHPSIVQNPFLQEQAAELGRRLVASGRVEGRKS